MNVQAFTCKRSLFSLSPSLPVSLSSCIILSLHHNIPSLPLSPTLSFPFSISPPLFLRLSPNRSLFPSHLHSCLSIFFSTICNSLATLSFTLSFSFSFSLSLSISLAFFSSWLYLPSLISIPSLALSVFRFFSSLSLFLSL